MCDSIKRHSHFLLESHRTLYSHLDRNLTRVTDTRSDSTAATKWKRKDPKQMWIKISNQTKNLYFLLTMLWFDHKYTQVNNTLNGVVCTVSIVQWISTISALACPFLREKVSEALCEAKDKRISPCHPTSKVRLTQSSCLCFWPQRQRMRNAKLNSSGVHRKAQKVRPAFVPHWPPIFSCVFHANIQVSRHVTNLMSRNERTLAKKKTLVTKIFSAIAPMNYKFRRMRVISAQRTRAEQSWVALSMLCLHLAIKSNVRTSKFFGFSFHNGEGLKNTIFWSRKRKRFKLDTLFVSLWQDWQLLMVVEVMVAMTTTRCSGCHGNNDSVCAWCVSSCPVSCAALEEARRSRRPAAPSVPTLQDGDSGGSWNFLGA